MYRNWQGQIIGQRLTYVWEGYARRLFLEFGELTPRVYDDGSIGQPCGEFTLTNMDSFRTGG